MNVPKDILEAIGGIAVEATMLEVAAANIAVYTMEEALDLVAESGAALQGAREKAKSLDDADLADVVRAWVTEADRLLREARHPIVHGFAYYDENGDWHAHHPKGKTTQPLDLGDLEERREQLEAHAALGLGVGSRVWHRLRLGADFPRTEEGG